MVIACEIYFKAFVLNCPKFCTYGTVEARRRCWSCSYKNCSFAVTLKKLSMRIQSDSGDHWDKGAENNRHRLQWHADVTQWARIYVDAIFAKKNWHKKRALAHVGLRFFSAARANERRAGSQRCWRRGEPSGRRETAAMLVSLSDVGRWSQRSSHRRRRLGAPLPPVERARHNENGRL